MVNFSLREFRGKVPAHGQLDFAVYGDKVFAVNVPNGCKIKFDNGEAVLFRTGIRFGVNGWFVSTINRVISVLASVPVIHDVALKVANAIGSNVFSKISIVNETSAIVNVEFLAGFGDISDDSTIVENVIDIKAPSGVPVYTKTGSRGYSYGAGALVPSTLNEYTLNMLSGFEGYVFFRNKSNFTVNISPLSAKNSGNYFYVDAGETVSFPVVNHSGVSKPAFTAWLSGNSTFGVGSSAGAIGVLMDS